MNKREKELFLKGLEVGMQLAEEYSEKEKPAKVDTGETKVKGKHGGRRVAYKEDELALLFDLTKSNEELARLIGRDKRAVAQKRYQMGIHLKGTESAKSDDGLANLGQKQ